MPEHVGEVPDGHRTPELGGAFEAELEVADDRLAGDEELVHEDIPGPHGEPAVRCEVTEATLGLGPDREVVVDHGHLPIEQEVGIGRVGLEPGEEVVEHLHQPQPERLERRVPLAIPVGVRDDRHASRHAVTVPTSSSPSLRRCAWRSGPTSRPR